jgi:hypothetical protein
VQQFPLQGPPALLPTAIKPAELRSWTGVNEITTRTTISATTVASETGPGLDVPEAEVADTSAVLKGRTRFGHLLVPAVLTAVVVATGMAYTLWWASVVRHKSYYWALPGDFWSTFRQAHFVAWGFISDIYSTGSALVTLPGYATILAPIAALSSAFGLTESAPQVFLPKPEAWLLAGPFVLLTAGVALAAFDALARRLGVSGWRRVTLLTAEAVAVWPSLSLWGHPEEVLAVAAAAIALTAAADGKWIRAGWLMGAAMAMQLLAALIVPILAGMAGARRRLPLLLRAAFLPAVLLAVVMIPDFHDSWKVLTQQRTPPSLNHPTPWVLLAPKVGPQLVAAGPSRIGAVLVALGCGVIANFWRNDLRRVVWLVAIVMAARCFFESVMTPYYVMPAVTVALIAAASRGGWRWTGALASGVALTVITHFHANMWIYYWVYLVPLLCALLVLSFPSRQQSRGHATDTAVADHAWASSR